MRSLVLGGNGFIGVHLVERLVEGGHEVRIYDRSPSRFRAVPRRVEYVEGELGNHGLVREALEGVEVAYHFVSTTLPKTSNDDPIYDVRSNLVDTIQFLEACVEARVRKVIFASSGGTVYGPPESTPISEDHPTNPITSYGIVKLAVEKYLGLFHHLYGLDYAVLRPRHLGEGHPCSRRPGRTKAARGGLEIGRVRFRAPGRPNALQPNHRGASWWPAPMEWSGLTVSA